VEPVIHVIGGGLAGSEAAFYLAEKGWSVRLSEMRPLVSNEVHQTDYLAELVCSNSFRSDDPNHPVGLLKREMERFKSLVMACARASAVPAGGALAVDRHDFSGRVTEQVRRHPRIELVREEVTKLPNPPAVIATGPLCSDSLAAILQDKLGDESLYFYDAIAPVIDYDSLDHSVVFTQSRYDKGGEDYLNIPLNKEEYDHFHDSLLGAELVESKSHEKMKFFEGCLPIEVMATRGKDTLRFGPMKPVGLQDPRTGETPYAVIQLRQDNYAKSLWNMVGFQTQMKWGEQKRIFRMLPGMEKAKFSRLGMIHRNTYLNSPHHLEPTFRIKGDSALFLAGQISGVEGYLESAASGLMAGIHLDRELKGLPPLPLPPETALGSLAHYVSHPGHQDFQPVNVNFGLFPALEKKMPKRQRRVAYVERAERVLDSYLTGI